jgi:hypothetical protein
MSWIEEGKFSLSNSPSGRRYVFRRKTNGVKLEINVPAAVKTKTQAQNWLRKHYKSPVVPVGRKKVRIPLLNLSKPKLPLNFMMNPHLTGKYPSPKGFKAHFASINSPPFNTGYNSAGKPKANAYPANSPKYPSPNKSKVRGFRITTPYGSINENAPKYDCSIGKRLFHRVAENYSIGFNQTGANNKSNSLTLVQMKNTMVRKGMAKLDTGKQGTVFLASFRRRAPPGTEFVIKVCPYDKTLKGKNQVAIIEDMIQNELYKVVPVHIPKPLAPLLFCQNFVPESDLLAKSNFNKDKDYSKQSVMFSEYISNGPFPAYIKKIASSPRKRLNDRFMKSAIFQVLNAIHKIRTKYPGFRHNDLHLENILVKPGKPYPIMVLNDFGYSTLDNKITNPLVANGLYAENWGMGPKTSPEYDVHLFLNEMRKECIRYKSASTDGFAKTLAFLNEVIPVGYRENTNKFTVRMRLRYNANYPGLLNLKQILKSSYFGGAAKMTPSPVKLSMANLNRKPYTSANLKHMNMSPNSRNWALGRKKKSPSPAKKKSPSPAKKKSPSPRKILSPSPNKKSPSPKKNLKRKRSVSPISPATSKIHISPSVLKSAKFNKLRLELLKNGTNESYYNRWGNTKPLALAVIRKRLKAGKPAYSAGGTPPKHSPPKMNVPKQGLGLKLFGKKKPVVKNAAKTPGGRIKVKGPSGRLVYADSLKVQNLMNIASRLKVKTNGLTTKKNIAHAIFSKV